MKSFPRSFEYRGYQIKKTSFAWIVRGNGVSEPVETIQDGKDLIDKLVKE